MVAPYTGPPSVCQLAQPDSAQLADEPLQTGSQRRPAASVSSERLRPSLGMRFREARRRGGQLIQLGSGRFGRTVVQQKVRFIPVFCQPSRRCRCS